MNKFLKLFLVAYFLCAIGMLGVTFVACSNGDDTSSGNGGNGNGGSNSALAVFFCNSGYDTQTLTFYNDSTFKVIVSDESTPQAAGTYTFDSGDWENGTITLNATSGSKQDTFTGTKTISAKKITFSSKIYTLTGGTLKTPSESNESGTKQDEDSGANDSGNGGQATNTGSAIFEGTAFGGTVKIVLEEDGTYLMTWTLGAYTTNKGKGTYTLTGTFENGTIHQHQTHWSDTLNSSWDEVVEDSDIVVTNGSFKVNIDGTGDTTFTKTNSSSTGGNSGSDNTDVDAKTYAINISNSIYNGTASLDKTTAKEGDTVKISTSPESGYVLGTVKVSYTEQTSSGYYSTSKTTLVDTENAGSGSHTFKMPAHQVDVNVTFKTSDGFVKVNGGTVEGKIGDSEIFINGRTVTIDDLYVCEHEVTQSEYEKYCTYHKGTYSDVENNPTELHGKGENYPVYYVNWYEAVMYCNFRSMDEGLEPVYKLTYVDTSDHDNPVEKEPESDPRKWGCMKFKDVDGEAKFYGTDPYFYCNSSTGKCEYFKVTCDFTSNGYRLPTDVEWEYIARGGNNGIPAVQTTYSGSNDADIVSWSQENSESFTSHEVMTKASNTLGVFDMSGNVYEYCWDWYEDEKHFSSDIPATGPDSYRGSDSIPQKVARGGSYQSLKRATKVSERNNFNIDNDEKTTGFRVVRKAKTPAGSNQLKKSYIVTFDANGQYPSNSKTIFELTVFNGDTVEKPEEPVAYNYKFDGWYTDSDCTSKFDFDTAITKSITLYAKWESLQNN